MSFSLVTACLGNLQTVNRGRKCILGKVIQLPYGVFMDLMRRFCKRAKEEIKVALEERIGRYLVPWRTSPVLQSWPAFQGFPAATRATLGTFKVPYTAVNQNLAGKKFPHFSTTLPNPPIDFMTDYKNTNPEAAVYGISLS